MIAPFSIIVWLGSIVMMVPPSISVFKSFTDRDF
jgi:hypothetical protein